MKLSRESLYYGERRHRPRRRSHIRIWIDPGGTAVPIDCLVVDRSEIGAKLMEIGGIQLPPEFEIRFERAAKPLKAHIVWRYGEMIGVAFEDEAPPLPAGP